MVSVLIHVPRFWPAIGGAELHSRRLAHELARYTGVGVLTHCQQGGVSLAEGAASSRAAVIHDDLVTIHRSGAAGPTQTLLQELGKRYERRRMVRPAYAKAFRTLMASPITRIVRRYDVVHSIYNGLTESTELLADTARKLGKPFIWTPLACTGERPGVAWSSKRFRRLYRQADALIALTDHEREWLIAHDAPADRVHVCPFGPLLNEPSSAQSFRRRHGLGSGPVILFLGRVTRAKGFDYLVDAANDIWQRHPGARIVFVGPQDEESRAFFRAHQDARLVTVEQVSQADKCAALQACDLLCLPSRAESLGVVYLEAWHFRKPVVALRLPVLDEVIKHNTDGLLAEHSAASVAEAVCRLLDHPAQARAMGNAGHAKLLRKYNWSQIGRQIADVHCATMNALAGAGKHTAAIDTCGT